jgi:hypothetical protein
MNGKTIHLYRSEFTLLPAGKEKCNESGNVG